MKKTFSIFAFALLCLAIFIAINYATQKGESNTESALIAPETDSVAEIVVDPMMPDQDLGLEIAATSHIKVPEIQQVNLDLPEIEVTEIKPIELTELKLPQAKVELPVLKQLKKPEFSDDSLSLDYKDPGNAESVIVDADGQIQSSGERTLKVDPQVIQAVEQQTGIPSAEIEQAFTQD